MMCPECGITHEREDVHGFCGVCDLVIRLDADKGMRFLRNYMIGCDRVEQICAERRASGRI